MRIQFVVILCSSLTTLGFFAGFIRGKRVTSSNSQGVGSSRSAQGINSSQKTFKAEPASLRPPTEILPAFNGDIINILGKKGSNVPHGKLLEDIMQTYQEIENFPYATKVAAWGSYLTACISLAGFEDLQKLTLTPDTEFVEKLKAEKSLMGGSFWDDLMSRSVCQFGILNRTEEIIRKAESQFESGDDLLASYSTSITATIYGSRSLTEIQQINSMSPAYQIAIKDSLLERWSKFDRTHGVDFLLSDNSGYIASEKSVESILNKDWFLENANDLSQKIDRSQPSLNRDLMIAQMLRIIGNSDPTLTNSWLNQISDAKIRSGALMPIKP